MPYVKIDQPMPKSVLWVFTFCVWAWVCYMSVYWIFKWMDNSTSEVPTLSVPRVSEQLQAIKLSDLALALGNLQRLRMERSVESNCKHKS